MFEKFAKSYNDSIESIHRFLEDKELCELTKWMMATDANPYSYLPESWAGSVSHAEGFAGLLHYIHHAHYDDGDMTFVTVNDEPRIVFYDKYEEGLREHALTRQEQELEQRLILGRRLNYEVKILDIQPNQFGGLYDEYQRKDIRKCFIHDAARLGILFAVDSYSKYKCFDSNWIVECKEEIENHWSRKLK